MENENNQCRHSACVCPVSDGQEFCSEYCREAVRQDITEIGCSCEHQGCIIS